MIKTIIDTLKNYILNFMKFNYEIAISIAFNVSNKKDS